MSSSKHLAPSTSPDPSKVQEAWTSLLKALGYDLSNPHFKETPERVARFLVHWHTQSGVAPPKLTAFPNDDKINQIVIVRDINFHSFCAHHGVSFHGHAHVGYIPGDSILGLSKFARVVDHFSHRFTTQEEIAQRVAEYLQEHLKPVAVGVVLEGEHLCMTMRGAQKPGATTINSVMKGLFFDDTRARNEFMTLVCKSRP